MSLTEIWKPIKDTDRYSISNFGRFRNNRTGYIQKPTDNGYGYKKVMISLNGKLKQYYIHRLVAEAFCLKQENQTEVDHIDGNRGNNVVENIRWVTHSENQLNMTQRGKNCKRKLTVEQVREIREKYKNGQTNLSKLGREYNVKHHAIRALVNRWHYQWVD